MSLAEPKQSEYERQLEAIEAAALATSVAASECIGEVSLHLYLALNEIDQAKKATRRRSM